MFEIFHRHKWGYAEGDSVGILSGLPRPMCFRRRCQKCGREEQIVRYTGIFKTGGELWETKGTFWLVEPEWMEVEKKP